MQTLEQFWTWFETDRPSPEAARDVANQSLESADHRSIMCGACEMYNWVTAKADWSDSTDNALAKMLEKYPDQLREFSFARRNAEVRVKSRLPIGPKAKAKG